MDALELLGIALASVAGILVATATTVACVSQYARRRRDQQLIATYISHPERVEEWLVNGAIHYLEKAGTAHSG